MSIIKQDYLATPETITVTGLDALANGARLQVEVDNTNNKNIADDYDVEVNGPAVGTIDIYRAGSNVSGIVPVNADGIENWVFVKSIDMTKTLQKIDFRLEQLKKYNTLMFHNDTGGVTTGYTITRVDANLNNDA